MSVAEQTQLLGLCRSTLYYKRRPESLFNKDIVKRLVKNHIEAPFLGRRKHTEILRREGLKVNHKRIGRLKKGVGLKTIMPKKRTSIGTVKHKKYPYLLRGVKIAYSNQVWAADITYIRVKETYYFLVAVIDWFSRYILSWRTSERLQTGFCIEALEVALKKGKPEIFNTDQGTQFTSVGFIEVLEKRGIQISMDGKGRYRDNIIIERFWRSLKCDATYTGEYEDEMEMIEGVGGYIEYYNKKRPHESLGNRTPKEAYEEGRRIAS